MLKRLNSVDTHGRDAFAMIIELNRYPVIIELRVEEMHVRWKCYSRSDVHTIERTLAKLAKVCVTWD